MYILKCMVQEKTFLEMDSLYGTPRKDFLWVEYFLLLNINTLLSGACSKPNAVVCILVAAPPPPHSIGSPMLADV